MNPIQVQQLFIHPIKGLSAAAVDEVRVRAGHGIVGDRAFALLFRDTQDAAFGEERALPFIKKKFLAMQNDWPALARLQCRYDFFSAELEIKDGAAAPLTANLDDEGDRQRVDAYFTEFLSGHSPSSAARHPQHAPLRLIGSTKAETRYPDRNAFHISVLNLGSLRDLAARSGRSIDIRRFRGNIIVDGAPWVELEWRDRPVQIGKVAVDVATSIERCNNINVDPDTAAVDAGILNALARSPGKGCFGVMASVKDDGAIRIGDRFVVGSATRPS